jgi:hypothetical protein
VDHEPGRDLARVLDVEPSVLGYFPVTVLTETRFGSEPRPKDVPRFAYVAPRLRASFSYEESGSPIPRWNPDRVERERPGTS